ncbi:MAG: hypothetical protein WC556_12845 [Candidatus Methanoperedens sp.]
MTDSSARLPSLDFPARHIGHDPGAVMGAWERAALGISRKLHRGQIRAPKKYIKMLINKSALSTAKCANFAKQEGFIRADVCASMVFHICENLRNLWIEVAVALLFADSSARIKQLDSRRGTSDKDPGAVMGAWGRAALGISRKLQLNHGLISFLEHAINRKR